jgi:Ca2+-binding EF-hand superfamily protein
MKTLLLLAAAAATLYAQDFGRGPGPGGRGGDGRGGEGRGRGPQQSYMRTSPILNALDTNHDNIISAEEINNAPASLLKLDKNGDGQLTPDELRPPSREPDPTDELVATLMAFDKNKDGKISRDELPARMQSMMDRGDTNHDGVLTVDEIRVIAKAQVAQNAEEDRRERPQREGGPPRQDPVTAALDTNHDGTISADEIAHASASLRTLDKNSDGQITEDEVRPPQQPGRGRGGNPDEMIARLFSELDKNNDGKISREEAAGSPLENLFERADRNKDGFIDRDELRTALQQREQ